MMNNKVADKISYEINREQRIMELFKNIKEEQAFPTPLGADIMGFIQGLTKREFFAALAMAGILTRTGWNSAAPEVAVHMADDLIQALKKKEEPKEEPKEGGANQTTPIEY